MNNFRELVQPLINHLILVGPDHRGIKTIVHNFVRSQPGGYDVDSSANLHTLELKTETPITEAVPRLAYVCSDVSGVSFRSTFSVYHDADTTGLVICTKGFYNTGLDRQNYTVRIYAGTKDEHDEIMAFMRRMNGSAVGV